MTRDELKAMSDVVSKNLEKYVDYKLELLTASIPSQIVRHFDEWSSQHIRDVVRKALEQKLNMSIAVTVK